MQTVKKLSLIFIGILLISGSAYGGFYFFKRNIKATPHNEVTPSQTNESLVGLKRDIKGEINSVFPKNLVPQKEIVAVVDSFVFTKDDKVTQYSFKYVSNQSFYYNERYFFKALVNGVSGWAFVDQVSDSVTFSSLNLRNEKGETLSVVINNYDANSATVELTLVTQK